MRKEKTATIEDLKNHYGRVLYKATDGNFYKLADLYPLQFEVENHPDCVCLDTGGEMVNCDFGVFKVEEGKLLREVHSSGEIASGEFKEVSSQLIIK